MKNINFASRPYFSEQGNVDDDATFTTIFSCSLQSEVCGLQSAVCKRHTPFVDTEFRSDKIKNFSLVRGYLTNFMVLESSSVMCCIAYMK